MASEADFSTSKHPEGSTPILTVNIPGGLAINLLGIIAETCPICFSVFPIYPDPLILLVEDKATNALGPESRGSYTPESHAFPLVTSIATGTSENVSDCPFKEKLIPCRHSSSGFGASKSIQRPKPSKHLKPLKPPKPLKYPKPLNPPKPLKHPKPLSKTLPLKLVKKVQDIKNNCNPGLQLFFR
ncbi:hypothetical protein [Bacillus sp. 1NLA3E]|uniref:hypothetical protein n=1 Tax=Bacillus sp. 1NLA3E TaxID=666686 RepID=UPI000247EB54|nr:hypothetical protein [Bacillus sp. 1NLA3E]